MKNTLQQSMAWLHTWAGLTFGWLLFGILLSGSLAVFYSELNFWAVPELPARADTDRAKTIEAAVDYLQKAAPDARLWQIVLPAAREPVLKITFKYKDGDGETRRLDPVTGEVVTRDIRGGLFYYRYHYQLLIDYHKNKLGLFIVAAAGIVMLMSCISGVMIHRHIFRDFFTFRPRSSTQRSWLDAHNILGVIPLPFHIMMAFTGLVLFYWLYIPSGMNVLYNGSLPAFRHDAITNEYQDLSVQPGAPAALFPIMPLVERAEAVLGAGSTASVYVRDPNRANTVTEIVRTRTDRLTQHFFKADYNGATGEQIRLDTSVTPAAQRLQGMVAALHWIEWGGPLVRWVYFLCGLASSVAVALGLILFTLKRSRQAESNARFYRVVESLNVASVAGFSLACIGFLWAERLAALDFAGRQLLINHIFVTIWLLTLVHAVWRRPRQAWVEQLLLCGCACIFLPITGFIVHRTLIQTLAEGDWIRSGVDMTSMGIGCIFVGMAVHLRRRDEAVFFAGRSALRRIAERA